MLRHFQARIVSQHYLLGRICAPIVLSHAMQCQPGTSVGLRTQRPEMGVRWAASMSACSAERLRVAPSSVIALSYAHPQYNKQTWALSGHIRMQQSTHNSQCVCFANPIKGMASKAGAEQSMQQPNDTTITAEQAPKSLDQLQQMTFPTNLPDAFHFFLMTLYSNGHFGDDRRENIKEVFEDVAAVKRALLDVARIRADIIYRISGENLSALAEAELPDDKKTVERKIRNANNRLQEWDESSHAQAAEAFASNGQIQKVLQPYETETPPPSLQDLLRLIWCWNTVAYPHLKSTCPSGERAAVDILHQTLVAYFSQPDPVHVEKTKSLKTITAEQKAEMLARMSQTDEQKQMFVSKADRIRYEQYLMKAQVPLKVGDWKCICNVFNFNGRQACWRCKHPATGKGVIIVTVADLKKKYGPAPSAWPKREGNRWLKHPGQPEDIRAEYRAKRDAVMTMRRAAKQARTAKRQAARAAREDAEAAGELPASKPPLLAKTPQPKKDTQPNQDPSGSGADGPTSHDKRLVMNPRRVDQRRSYTTTAPERVERNLNESNKQPVARKRFVDLLDDSDFEPDRKE